MFRSRIEGPLTQSQVHRIVKAAAMRAGAGLSALAIEGSLTAILAFGQIPPAKSARLGNAQTPAIEQSNLAGRPDGPGATQRSREIKGSNQ